MLSNFLYNANANDLAKQKQDAVNNYIQNTKQSILNSYQPEYPHNHENLLPYNLIWGPQEVGAYNWLTNYDITTSMHKYGKSGPAVPNADLIAPELNKMMEPTDYPVLNKTLQNIANQFGQGEQNYIGGLQQGIVNYYNNEEKLINDIATKEKEAIQNAYAGQIQEILSIKNQWEKPQEDKFARTIALAGNWTKNSLEELYKNEYKKEDARINAAKQAALASIAATISQQLSKIDDAVSKELKALSGVGTQNLESIDKLKSQLDNLQSQLTSPETAKAMLISTTSKYMTDVLNRINSYAYVDHSAIYNAMSQLTQAYVNSVEFANSYNNMFKNYFGLQKSFADMLYEGSKEGVEQSVGDPSIYKGLDRHITNWSDIRHPKTDTMSQLIGIASNPEINPRVAGDIDFEQLQDMFNQYAMGYTSYGEGSPPDPSTLWYRQKTDPFGWTWEQVGIDQEQYYPENFFGGGG